MAHRLHFGEALQIFPVRSSAVHSAVASREGGKHV